MAILENARSVEFKILNATLDLEIETCAMEQ
jgi:hypothetical protein